MTLHRTILLGGAARLAESVFHLQALKDASLLPINYKRELSRKKYRALKKKKKAPYISTAAKRVWKQIRYLEGTIDILAWSMGVLVAIETKKIADKLRPGFVRAIIGICPAVFGGPIPQRLHLNPAYIFKMWVGSKIWLGARTKAAVREIRESDPTFSYRCSESKLAMLEAITGVVELPHEYVKNGDVFIFYSPEDEVIPVSVTEFMLARAGIQGIPVPGYNHDLPVLDTKGTVLRMILALVAAHYEKERTAKLR